ncbi:class II fumarate hydratase [Caldalkalibacillus salinus]|uniref:class II fumarate hydratase n=1 Tax=Caldalkalibacillus salinus TaxID=2803787 RepID=UPI0019242328|nr:class II fumarate hydratase [Caldalkalibacillus salinus]
MDYRIEKDTLGEIKVPADKLWGPQTQRSLENFKIGQEMMPQEVLRALALLKKCAALTNEELGELPAEKAHAITTAADEVLQGKWDEHFPLVVWQTGSGTQSNMNMNEVLANRANQILQTKGSQPRVHPNDDVNRGQSSNDTFPSAIYISGVMLVEDRLRPSLQSLQATLEQKQRDYQDVIKIGRTHLQDATPMTFGQEVSAWQHMLKKNDQMISESVQHMNALAIGGTAVGTGLNAHPEFGQRVAEKVSKLTGQSFTSSENKFHALTSYDALVYVHGTLKALAADLMKIANDIRWLSSGPRAGLGEIQIPANEPGSSIMPGKVNPTQSEALTMVACQVIGNDTTIGVAASQGHFQLNTFKPVLAHNFLQSVRLLADAMASFDAKAIQGLMPDKKAMAEKVNQSLMLVTALNPHIGYEKAATIAKSAYEQGITLKEAAINSGIMTAEAYDQYVQPAQMTNQGKEDDEK